MAGSSGALRRKRRSGSVCANPLFVRWLEEWRDEAQKAGKKTVYTYSKALNSVKKYPLTLKSGKEAKILENVGDKIARMLDNKIGDHLANGGSLQDLQGIKRYKPAADPVLPKKRPTLQSASCNAINYQSSPPHSSQQVFSGISPRTSPHLQESSEVEPINSSPYTKKKKKMTLEYIPTYRSGSYAILIALLKAEENPSYRGFMSKQELLEAAQPYCDASFKEPSKGTYYTAWNSMSTIIGRRLVSKYSHPPRYSLTKDGQELAMKLLQAKPNTRSPSPTLPQLRTSFHLTEQNLIKTSNFSQEITSNSFPRTETDSFRFWYVDSAGKCVREKDCALVTISDELSVGFLVKCDRLLLERYEVRHVIDTERGMDGPYVFAFIHNDSAPYQCNPPVTDTGLAVPSSSSSKCLSHCVNEHTSSNSEDGDLSPPQLTLRVQALRSEPSLREVYHVPTPPTSFNAEDLCSCGDGGQSIDRTSSVNDSPKTCEGETCSSQDNSQSLSTDFICESQSRESTERQKQPENKIVMTDLDLSNPEHVLHPGEFEVVLCVDNSESTASRKSVSHFRGMLLEELAKNGVKFSVRKLNVGDFLWVAQEKVAYVTGQLRLPSSTEVVLEYIVERKRLDDLAGSIIDRRFQEQKYRLKHCGIIHPTYLVEEQADLFYCSLAPSALQQAITNTQVQDGFYIKQTSNVCESVAYLTLMTRHLQSLYSSKTLKTYPIETVLSLNRQKMCGGKAFLDDKDVVHSMTFNSFNQASVKTKVPTVSEMFARHLILIPKSSADKAHAIVQMYPTVSHLKDAYQRCATDKERDCLLQDIRAGATKRRIGPALSSTICSLYWKGSQF